MGVVSSAMNASPEGSCSHTVHSLLKKIEVAPTVEIPKLSDCKMNLAHLFLNNTKAVSDELVKINQGGQHNFLQCFCCNFNIFYVCKTKNPVVLDTLYPCQESSSNQVRKREGQNGPDQKVKLHSLHILGVNLMSVNI